MNIVVIGAQWGDEGKGKIVDFLAPGADLVVRFSGGANAGHTIVHNDVTYKLHLVPSGIVYPDKTVVLGSGMVIDPKALFEELAVLEEQGVQWKGRVLVSDRAHLVLPRYRDLDKDLESLRLRPIGTTGRGIGVAYAQKSARDSLRVIDLYDEECWNAMPDTDRDFLSVYRDKLKDMMVNMAGFMAGFAKKKVLFEGAQGTLLDLDLGTYPYVSSGVSAAAGACLGASIGPRAIDRVVGVFKAYSSRVGNGPFPTQFDSNTEGDLEKTVRELGREYGVTTGRPRRCGYLDLVSLRYACQVNSLDGLVLTHLDVYDSMDEIKVCVAYEIDGKIVTDFPSSISDLNTAKPVLESFKGWKQDIGAARDTGKLPKAAREYIAFIEAYTATPVDIVSVGYRREQTIIKRNPWKK